MQSGNMTPLGLASMLIYRKLIEMKITILNLLELKFWPEQRRTVTYSMKENWNSTIYQAHSLCDSLIKYRLVWIIGRRHVVIEINELVTLPYLSRVNVARCIAFCHTNDR